MHVLTIGKEEFPAECKKLFEKVDSSGIKYELIIGIATGGAYVGRIFSECSPYSKYLEVKLQRSGTGIKEESHFKQMLTRLPYAISNLLRVIEHYIRSSKKVIADSGCMPQFSEEEMNFIQKAKSILVIDDALDTGKTMYKLVNYLQKLDTDRIVHSAVMTMTMKKRLIDPTYYNYRYILIRWPWSFDYKGKN